MVERGSELIHLLLADAFGIPGQDLGLNLVDGSGDGREEQLPPDTDMLLMLRDGADMLVQRIVRNLKQLQRVFNWL